MLPINRLLEYQAETCETLRDFNNIKLFNYTDMVIDDSELSKILKEREEHHNTFLISVMPDYHLKGSQDNAKWENVLQFFVLDKTHYSEHDRDSFRDIFVQTQQKALAFVKQLISDKTNHKGSLCNFLTWLDEGSISVTPVWKKDGCNGWTITINFDTPL